MLTRNPPIDRLKFIVKTYGEKQPWVVLDTLSVIFDTIGVDNAEEELEEEIKRQGYAVWGDDENRMVSRVRAMFGLGGKLHAGLVAPAQQMRGVPYSKQLSYWWFGDSGFESMVPGFSRQATTLNEKLSLILELSESSSFADGAMAEAHEADGILPWVARELSKVSKYVIRQTEEDQRSGLSDRDPQALDYLPALESLRRSGNAIAQWAKLNRIDLMKLSLAEVLEAIKTFRYSGKVRQGKVVHKFKSGWTIQELRTKRELDDEHKALNHCVDTYCGRVARGRSVIYSLRDPDGVPYVTMEWQPDPNKKHGGHFEQVFGKANVTTGSQEFADYVFQAGQENKPPLTKEQVPEVVDAIQRMLGEFIGKHFGGEPKGIMLAGAPFPSNTTVIDGNLGLDGYRYPLPAGLTSVGGGLYLRGYKHPLPDGLTSVGGSLDLYRHRHPLPEGLTSVGGNIDLRGYPHPLPKGLKVGGRIYR